MLAIQEEPKITLPSHPLPSSLLKHSNHMFPKGIPSALSSKRDIQHHIDLIPGFVLPNKPSYRMNPKDTMEIQRQVK